MMGARLTIDDVIAAVREAREDGPEALAALAVSCGATALGGVLRVATLHRKLAEARDAMQAADEDIAALRHERDGALAELKAARESLAKVRTEARDAEWRLESERGRAEAEREAAAEALADAARLRALVDAARDERDRAVREREDFSLRASSAEYARDENRNAWATACRELNDLGLRLSAAERERDEARTRVEALARPCVGHPTPVERAAHIAAGGEWVMLWRHGGDWRCYSTSEHSNTVADAIYIATRDGLPCAWPVAR